MVDLKSWSGGAVRSSAERSGYVRSSQPAPVGQMALGPFEIPAHAHDSGLCRPAWPAFGRWTPGRCRWLLIARSRTAAGWSPLYESEKRGGDS